MATYWENSCSFGLRYVSCYKFLIVGLVFSHLGFWSGNLFLIAPFPDLCLLVPFYLVSHKDRSSIRSLFFFLYRKAPPLTFCRTRYTGKIVCVWGGGVEGAREILLNRVGKNHCTKLVLHLLQFKSLVNKSLNTH